jgi:hypothetical protein
MAVGAPQANLQRDQQTGRDQDELDQLSCLALAQTAASRCLVGARGAESRTVGERQPRGPSGE